MTGTSRACTLQRPNEVPRHPARPLAPTSLLFRMAKPTRYAAPDLLAVLLLDPRGDVQAPRVRHQQRASHVEAVHRAPAQDVEQVALRDAVDADHESNARGHAKHLRRHVLANAKHNRVRVILVAPPRVHRLQLLHGDLPGRRRTAGHSRPDSSSRRKRRAGAHKRKKQLETVDTWWGDKEYP